MAGALRDDVLLSPFRIASSPGLPGVSEGRQRWRVDVRNRDLFLYISLVDVTRIGLFVPTFEPSPIGAPLDLLLTLRDGQVMPLLGSVQWLNPWRPDGDNLNPGMGVSLPALELEQREQLVAEICTLAYLR